LKFAHLADTHIRNLKYHKEYKEVFSQLYIKLRELNVDYIIHCGDIAHTKTHISPEFVDMCSDFFKNLADIAPTYIILGNHDGNLRNSSRQDALTPIATALNHSNLYLLKNSGEVILNDNFTINVLSVFDRDSWQSASDPSRINIALYHGSISGVKTDTGWVMENGEDDNTIFNNFDYGFLGDIHKTNQTLDEKGKIRYPGSTIQQNHGETDDKGFLFWNIEDKENFICEHHTLKNPKPFVTVKLTPTGRLPSKIKIPQLARLRLVSENNLSLDLVRKAVNIAKTRFSPESVTYLSRDAGARGSVENLAKLWVQEDLRDLNVQKSLIKEYLKDYHLDADALKKIYEMNKKYDTAAGQTEEVSRNINWHLKKLEWDNLFNYGESNSLNFDNLTGVVGILGKNFSGKSSIIDSFLYTMYNTSSKNNRKNINLINLLQNIF
jgi:DNA repair exonuclease SbcCD nuclease subunit